MFQAPYFLLAAQGSGFPVMAETDPKQTFVGSAALRQRASFAAYLERAESGGSNARRR